MEVELINKIKTFNSPEIKDQINALTLPAVTVKFSGFINERFQRLSPFPESSRVISTKRLPDGSIQEDSADTGDIRFETRNPLTPAEVTSINGVLDAHDGTVDNPRQARDRQSVTDIATLRTIFDAGISDPTLNLTTKLILRENGEDV